MQRQAARPIHHLPGYAFKLLQLTYDLTNVRFMGGRRRRRLRSDPPRSSLTSLRSMLPPSLGLAGSASRRQLERVEGFTFPIERRQPGSGSRRRPSDAVVARLSRRQTC